MTLQPYNDIVTSERIYGAIFNFEFEGFDKDYSVLHCLLKMHRPRSVFETGTNRGTGTKIMKNALGFDSVIFSLDLPFEHIHHTLKQGTKDLVGTNCNLPYIQLRGDSLTFDFSKYPCEAAWIDSEHDYDHPFTEATAMIKNGTKLIMFHDLHVVPVQEAVRDAFKDHPEYEVFRVDGTRIAYALKNPE